MQVRLTTAAEQDLADIHAFIAEGNPSRADSFLDEMESMIRDLVLTFGRLPVRPDLPGSPGVARHGRYRIYFRHDRDRVTVLRILHAVRDAGQLLAP